MGGCCCSARKPHLHGAPVYYYCPPPLEEHECFASNDGTASSFTARLLVGLDLETSIPDTYQPPPAPLPYDIDFGYQPSIDSKSSGETISASSLDTITTFEETEESEPKAKSDSLVLSPQKLELSKSSKSSALQVEEEEDVCPICLEEYDVQNPKLMTNCEHHFHLSCILEWMERSDSCPICDQEMMFDYPPC